MAIYWKYNQFTGISTATFDIDFENYPEYEIKKLERPTLKSYNKVPEEHWSKIETYKMFREYRHKRKKISLED